MRSLEFTTAAYFFCWFSTNVNNNFKNLLYLIKLTIFLFYDITDVPLLLEMRSLSLDLARLAIIANESERLGPGTENRLEHPIAFDEAIDPALCS